MLALAATAVSTLPSDRSVTDWFLQIHAALFQWNSGKFVSTSFSVDGFGGIYDEHMTTVENLQENPELAPSIPSLLAKIYQEALYVLSIPS